MISEIIYSNKLFILINNDIKLTHSGNEINFFRYICDS